MKQDRGHRTPLTIYKDISTDINWGHQSELSKSASRSWLSLGAQAERNKENNALPSKWTSNKIPQRTGHRFGGATASSCIEIFVDEECAEIHKEANKDAKSSILQLRQGDDNVLKRETELLRENPLRNFPPSCLPR